MLPNTTRPRRSAPAPAARDQFAGRCPAATMHAAACSHRHDPPRSPPPAPSAQEVAPALLAPAKPPPAASAALQGLGAMHASVTRFQDSASPRRSPARAALLHYRRCEGSLEKVFFSRRRPSLILHSLPACASKAGPSRGPWVPLPRCVAWPRPAVRACARSNSWHLGGGAAVSGPCPAHAALPRHSRGLREGWTRGRQEPPFLHRASRATAPPAGARAAPPWMRAPAPPCFPPPAAPAVLDASECLTKKTLILNLVDEHILLALRHNKTATRGALWP